ncbi:ATP-dependent zinc metalloprotease FtsH [bacterium]|nr:ATP-dependent zinc metalloprotease FtsH [bacterium]NBX72226.1 ATP-dependent zinc metalloprotease FtsH [bacterium]
MNDVVKNLVLWLTIALIFVSAFSGVGTVQRQPRLFTFDEFLQKVSNKEIIEAEIDTHTIRGQLQDHSTYYTVVPQVAPQVLQMLIEKNIKIIGKRPEQPSLLLNIFVTWFPIILLIAVYYFLIMKLQGGMGGRGAMSFGKSRARMLEEDQIKITFADVAGVDEAKREVQELVDFLRNPSKFQNIGGKIPKGVLMVGQPGTGKTLLAKAISGEARVPFFSISGSDFVEMFVGVGASRVRDMFEQARKHAPCIIFIDEIDAVGRHRGAGLGGGHDEREQTLNQLLVEMDGFEGHEGIIVIAATNRPDVLDKALLRPGRFDRRVTVGLPDLKGRSDILKVHLKKIQLEDNIDPTIIARGTPGFSGADLANLVNEAALFAAREDKAKVSMLELDKARDKIIMGPERRSMVMTEEEKRLTAYHESGHTIVGLFVADHDPVYKVTIIPRAQALGVTMYLPETERYSISKEALESKLATLFGGRVAEEIIFGLHKVTTGASNDIERATDIARNMVTRWGLSTRIGPLNYADEEGEVFLGRTTQQRKEISEETTRLIDEEIKGIINQSYTKAKEILQENIELLHRMAEALLVYETLDKDQIALLFEGKSLPPLFVQPPVEENH